MNRGASAPHPEKLLKKFHQNFNENRAKRDFMKGSRDWSLVGAWGQSPHCLIFYRKKDKNEKASID
jgi:hypothetical protein